MNKIKTIAAVAATITIFSALGASAQDMNMYVNDHYVVRDMQTVSGFDMLPVLDIAGELGFNCSFDGTTIKLYNDSKSYVFTVGSASVYDESGNWYGLDVVPQVMNGKVRVPAKFFQDAMGMSYVWDAVTNTIFLGSENTYNWLIGTGEYQKALKTYNQISYDEAVSLVRNYFITYQGVEPPEYMCWNETEDKWVIRAYENIYYNGQYSHSPAFGIISVNKNTGALYDEILLHPITDDNGNYVGWMY